MILGEAPNLSLEQPERWVTVWPDDMGYRLPVLFKAHRAVAYRMEGDYSLIVIGPQEESPDGRTGYRDRDL